MACKEEKGAVKDVQRRKIRREIWIERRRRDDMSRFRLNEREDEGAN